MSSDRLKRSNHLQQVERRLLAIDSRLQHAKRARDDYIKFLKNKYPQWNPPDLLTYTMTDKLLDGRQNAIDYEPRRPDKIIDRLSTSKYHWDLGQGRVAIPPRKPQPNLEPNDPIPSSGPMLETDLQRVRKRLNEIASDLRILRDHRIHLSSVQFYRTVDLATLQPPTKFTAMNQDRGGISLTETRQRINQIDATSSPDVPEPSKDDLDVIRAEELLKKYRDQLRNDDESVAPFDKTNTEKDPRTQSAAINANNPDCLIAPKRTILFKMDREQNVRSSQKEQPQKASNIENEHEKSDVNLSGLKAYDGDQMMAHSQSSSNYRKMLDILNKDPIEDTSSDTEDSFEMKLKTKQSTPMTSHKSPAQNTAITTAQLTVPAPSGTSNSSMQAVESAKSGGESFLSRILGEQQTEKSGQRQPQQKRISSSSDEMAKKIAPKQEDDSDSDFFA
ncbi:unnamed protein product [Anisakis simplex]|uniref:NADH-ubiquinone oxidoreductase B17 subunit n=1 Tax=Anisakis simplex TaxID=6269 RepID=A0A0M3JV56_ANISI|nr:unnamed protein product [Anisakis simplex]